MKIVIRVIFSEVKLIYEGVFRKAYQNIGTVFDGI